METLRSILCPVDFSEQSRHALRLAGALAARYKSRLVVLSVVDPLLVEAAKVRLGLDLVKGDTQPALAEFVKATWPGDLAHGPDTVLDVRVGHPSDVILETAARDAVDLIVMGTQGLGGFRKWLLGSTTEHVLRRTQTPVLVVPPIESGISHVSAVPFGVGLVLAATDFSEPSAAAVRSAVQFAEQFAVPLVLAHIVESATVPPQWGSYVDESNEARVADARARLKQLAEQFSGSRVSETIVSLGRPADAIAAIAQERRAGLIVMGLTGDQGPFSQRPGSIAYRVLCSADVPVLVVPTP